MPHYWCDVVVVALLPAATAPAAATPAPISAALVVTTTAEPAAPPAPRVVDPHRVYCVDEFQKDFRLTKSTVRREVRQRRLRVAKRAGRYYLLGEWVLEWLRGGEVRPRRRDGEGGER